MNRSDNLIKNTFILSIGAICTKVLTFVLVPIFSRWLSTSEYGDFDLFCTYITLLIPLITLSCGEAVFRKLIDANDNNTRKKIVSTAIAIVFIGILILVVFAPVVFRIVGFDHVIPFLILGIAELLNTFMTYYSRGIRRLKLYTIANILFVCSMALAVTVFVHFLNLGLDGILLGYATGYIISFLFLVISTHFFGSFSLKSINKDTLKEIISYSAPLIPNSISWWIANVSDRTVINIVLGSSINGIYAIANKIPAICTALFSVFHLSWQETASDSVSSEDRDKYYNAVYNSTSKMIVSISMVVLSFNTFLFDYIFDDRYYTARYHVPILMTAIIFSFIAQFLGGIFIALQNTKANGMTTVIAAIVNIIVDVSTIRYIGLYAASVSTLVAYLFLFIIRVYMVRREIMLRLDNKCYFIFAIYMAVAIIQYLEMPILHFISFLVATILFCIINKAFIIRVLNIVRTKL